MSENSKKSGLESSAADHSGQSLDVIDLEKRRRFAKLAVGAPLVVTLASRPVFGGQCLSNMMSGNLSDPNRGHCSKGWSPGGWGQPGGTIHTYSTLAAWTRVGFVYGVYDPTICSNSNSNSKSKSKSNGASISRSDCYRDGATLENVPKTLNKGSLPITTPLRDILNEPQLNQLTRHLICAYLNAMLSELSGSSFHYILTTSQVVGLANGATPLPPKTTTLQAFLGSTWNL